MFDRYSRTIDGKPAYLFRYTPEIDTLRRTIDGIAMVVEQYRDGRLCDLVALIELLDGQIQAGAPTPRRLSEYSGRTTLVAALQRRLHQLSLDGGRVAIENVVTAVCFPSTN